MKNTIQLRIKDKIRETAQVATLVLEAVGEDLKYEAGQFLTFIFNIHDTEIRRSYSISTAPNVDKDIAITVKKVANGIISKLLVDTLNVGDMLHALPPAGQFTLQNTAAPSDIFLIGGGSGITPLFGLLKSILSQTSDSRVILINSNRNQHQIIFKQQLSEWAKRFPDRLKIIHFISRPIADLPTTSSNERFQQGYLSNFKIEQIIQKELKSEEENAQFYLCGPEGIMLKSRMTISAMGFPKANIHREIFIIKGSFRPDATRFQDSEVTLVWENNRQTFSVKAGETILEAAQKANIYIPYNCQSGICTICSCQRISGKAIMYTQEGVFDSDMIKGVVFTCVGYPLTGHLELKFRGDYVLKN